MSAVDFADLRAKALGARRRGPWTHSEQTIDHGLIGPMRTQVVDTPDGNLLSVADADTGTFAFVAACDPDTVLALLDEVERLRHDRDALTRKAEAGRVLAAYVGHLPSCDTHETDSNDPCTCGAAAALAQWEAAEQGGVRGEVHPTQARSSRPGSRVMTGAERVGAYECPCQRCPRCGFMDADTYHPEDGLAYCPSCGNEWWAHIGSDMDGRHIMSSEEEREWDAYDSWVACGGAEIEQQRVEQGGEG